MSGIDVYSYEGTEVNGKHILKFTHFKNYKKSRQPFFDIKCKCGRVYNNGLWSIRRKGGCQNCKRIAMKLPEGEASFNYVYGTYKYNGERRGFEFELSKDEFKDIIEKNCHYCNQEPSNIHVSPWNNGDLIYSGIDRKNPKKGYTVENCVPCCYICNRAKSDMSFSEFANWVKRLKDVLI